MKDPIRLPRSCGGSQAQSESCSRFGFAFSAVSLAAALAISFPFGAHTATILVPSGSIVTIQDGVDAAAPGDTIKVLPGTYDENVSVTTPLIKIQAETETGPVTVRGVLIQADHVEIEGFQVEPLFLPPFLPAPVPGIHVTNADGVHVSHNTVIDRSPSGMISLTTGGILISSSSNVHIDYNTVNAVPSEAGICVEDSFGTHVNNNVATVEGEAGVGIHVVRSSGTRVNHNSAYAHDILSSGIRVSSSSDGQINNNNANGYLEGIFVTGDSRGNSFVGNTAVGNIFGIVVTGDSCENRFVGNTATHLFSMAGSDLSSDDDPTAPCNLYKNNDAATAFPSLGFWGVK